MIFDELVPTATVAPEIVQVKTDQVRVSALVGESFRFAVTEDHEWGKKALGHNVENLIATGKLTEEKGNILRVFEEQVTLADDYFALLGERIEFCKNNFSVLKIPTQCCSHSLLRHLFVLNQHVH